MKIVKRFLAILFCMCFICITASDATGDKTRVIDYTESQESSLFWQEVENLIKQNESEIAYSQIAILLKSKYSLEHIQSAVQNTERHFNLLHKNNTNFKKSNFNAPEETLLNKATKFTNSLSFGIWGVGLDLYSMHRTDKKNYAEAVKQKFPFVDKDKANATLLQYDIIKKNLKIYMNLLITKYPLTGSTSDKQAYLNLKRQCEILKRNIIASRCNYVSYHVVSPRMAEVSKQLYLATFKWLGLDDKQKIKEAVLLLARSCHYNWLYTSYEDVRIQFCETIKNMKDIVGKAEWEEFKVLTSMLDADDPSKKRGADAWWEEK